MKDPISYYEEDFGRELYAVQNATTATIKDSISIVSLLPTDKSPGLIDEHARAFKSQSSQLLFLFSYFFTTLIDQAIHSALREEHPYFDRLARYPKLVGILATYHHNIHPALLLLVATLYTNEEDQSSATEQFYALCDFFADDYGNFIIIKYPSMTGRLQTEKERYIAGRELYIKLSNVLALFFIPRSLRPYSSLSPDINLYEKWIRYFSRKINAKLNEYEKYCIA
jgi:hypothetical protein